MRGVVRGPMLVEKPNPVDSGWVRLRSVTTLRAPEVDIPQSPEPERMYYHPVPPVIRSHFRQAFTLHSKPARTILIPCSKWNPPMPSSSSYWSTLGTPMAASSSSVVFEQLVSAGMYQNLACLLWLVSPGGRLNHGSRGAPRGVKARAVGGNASESSLKVELNRIHTVFLPMRPDRPRALDAKSGFLTTGYLTNTRSSAEQKWLSRRRL